MNKVQTCVQLIHSMNADEVNQIVEAVKLQRTYLARSACRGVQVGDTVSFRGRRGQTVTGTVEKVNRKTVVVNTGATKWRVTASLLNTVPA